MRGVITVELVHKIETMTADWFKQAHLPPNGRKWLADNVWWIVIVGVVVSVMSIFALVPLLLGAAYLASAIGGAYGAAAYTGLALTGVWVSLGFMVAILVVEAMAIKPLQNKQKKGWDLMFLALLLSVLSTIVSVVLLANVGGLIGAALTFLIGGYFMFEVRDHFAAGHSKVKSAKSQATK